MNRDKDLEIIRGFVGKECERTLACNSLKIRFGEKVPYIWIDAPWDLYKNHEPIASSLEYPESDEDFKSYSETLNPINKTRLVDFEFSIKNGLVLHFENGISLNAPPIIEAVDDDSFYHHWYAQL